MARHPTRIPGRLARGNLPAKCRILRVSAPAHPATAAVLSHLSYPRWHQKCRSAHVRIREVLGASRRLTKARCDERSHNRQCGRLDPGFPASDPSHRFYGVSVSLTSGRIDLRLDRRAAAARCRRALSEPHSRMPVIRLRLRFRPFVVASGGVSSRYTLRSTIPPRQIPHTPSSSCS